MIAPSTETARYAFYIAVIHGVVTPVLTFIAGHWNGRRVERNKGKDDA